MEAVRVTLYVLTIVSATVTWCLAAAFLALTHEHLGIFWRGDIALLVFGILAMLFLPFLMCLGFGHRRGSLTGPTIAESIAVFVFWCLFLAATAKFSSTYNVFNGWRTRCRFGFSMCPTGRALLSFGWITFGLLSLLLIAVIIHGVLAEKRRKGEEQRGGDIAEGRDATATRQVEPNSTSQTTAVAKGLEGGNGSNLVPHSQMQQTPLTTTQAQTQV
ncbi:hypothetical protein JCM16303_002917 [Sporobolomyces ruberrimus]